MTTVATRGGQRWVAGAMSLAAADPLAVADALGVPSIYWEQPLKEVAVAGWGEVAVVEARSEEDVGAVLETLVAPLEVRWLGEAPEGVPGPWFGGMRFEVTTPAEEGWEPHGLARWTLPELLVWRVGTRAGAVAFAREEAGGEERVKALLEQVRANLPTGHRHPRGGPVALRLSSSREDFEALVDRALRELSAGDLKKVVLARAVEAEGPAPFELVEVLTRLREHNPSCVTFLFRVPGGAAFLGATPETLCRVEGQRLETEALAGSAAPGQAEGLGSCDKDHVEHDVVVRYIISALRPLAEQVSADGERALVRLRNVVHLRTGIQAELRKGVGPARVLAALHPTPAVGGVPRERALEFLREHEALDRGWYAGPVGWMGPDGAHLVVALRSALVRGERARLFVGAGIVPGSRPEAEWRETEIKSLAMLRALGGEDVRREP